MRHAATSLLLALVVATAIAPAATASPPNGSIRVYDPSVLCPALAAPAGCFVHMEGELELKGLVFGMEVHEATCLVEVVVKMDSLGEGRVQSFIEQVGEHEDQSCGSTTPCNMPWAVHGEESGANTIAAPIQICIDPAETTTCNGTAAMTITSSPSPITATFANARIGSSMCVISGQLAVEASEGSGYTNILIQHI